MPNQRLEALRSALQWACVKFFNTVAPSLASSRDFPVIETRLFKSASDAFLAFVNQIAFLGSDRNDADIESEDVNDLLTRANGGAVFGSPLFDPPWVVPLNARVGTLPPTTAPQTSLSPQPPGSPHRMRHGALHVPFRPTPAAFVIFATCRRSTLSLQFRSLPGTPWVVPAAERS